MPFPEVIAVAQRDDVLSRVIEALDICEEVYRNLDDAKPHLVALDDETFTSVRRKVKGAYAQLMQARQAIDAAAKV